MIIAITLTGGRPEAFALCEQYIARQSVKPDIWIVVDDVNPPSLPKRIDHVMIRPEPERRHYHEPTTQHRNMMAAIQTLEGQVRSDDLIFFWEDDDHYAPTYIEQMAATFAANPAVQMIGEQPARYYRVDKRYYREFEPTPHASLASTAIRASMIPALIHACECRAWIDMYLWRRHNNVGLCVEDHNVIGIKGMPGARGYSEAHRQDVEHDQRWTADPNLAVLREWIGDDADLYIRFGKVPDQTYKDWSSENVNHEFKTFLSHGQVRYRCPECPYDHYRPAEVAKHVFEIHRDETAMDAGPPVTLFDAAGKVVTRKIVKG